MPDRFLVNRKWRCEPFGRYCQTVIEPTIDMWLREKRPNNIVINDPKGELLVKNYVRATVRGLQVVQFNLINAMKTDIYNRVPRSTVKSRGNALVA